jgi:hypothetical protein
MRSRTWLLPLAAILIAVAGCDIPGTTPPTPFVFPTPNATLTAVFAPTATSSVPSTSTPTPVDTMVPTVVTPIVPGPTATVGSLNARPNGVVIEAGRVSPAPVVDGDLSDWSALPYKTDQIVFGASNWSGPNDASGLFALAWDDDFLYLAVRVVDDLHVQIRSGDNLWLGDDIEIQLDTNLAADYYTASMSADDYQIGLSAGDFGGNPADSYRWYPQSRKGRPSPAITIARKAASNGYDAEARIPWSTFGVTPAEGSRYGFALSLSDDDLAGKAAQQSMVSSVSTRKLLNPTTWGTLALTGTVVK